MILKCQILAPWFLSCFAVVIIAPLDLHAGQSAAAAPRSRCEQSISTVPTNCDKDLNEDSPLPVCSHDPNEINEKPKARCLADEMDGGHITNPAPIQYTDYAKAVGKDGWNAPEDIAAWIAGKFQYDGERAAAANKESYKPEDFFDKPVGICADLANFTKDALNKLRAKTGVPSKPAMLLKINFDPCMLKTKKALRRHWMATYKVGNDYFFMGDSKQQGKIYGPCRSPDEFVKYYQKFRCRRVRCMSVQASSAMEIWPPPTPSGMMMPPPDLPGAVSQ